MLEINTLIEIYLVMKEEVSMQLSQKLFSRQDSLLFSFPVQFLPLHATIYIYIYIACLSASDLHKFGKRIIHKWIQEQ